MLFGAISIAATFLLSLGLTLNLLSASGALRVLDRPNKRSLHDVPRLRTGGLAILSSVTVAAMMSALVGQAGWGTDEFAAVTSALVSTDNVALGLAVLLIAIVSFCDDRWGVSPGLRLVAQVLATIGVMATGLIISEVPIPMVGALKLGPFALPVTLVIVVWASNLFNFMDGMDGLAPGMAVCGFLCLGLIVFTRGALDLALLCALIAAASGGFLRFNLPPALLFMGDVGSVPLGFTAGVLAIRATQDGACDIWVPALIFSPFFVDATVVLVQRLLRGARLWSPHREHAYQRLVLSGWSQGRTLSAEYALMVSSAFVAVMYATVSSDPARLVILVSTAIVYAVLIVGVNRLEIPDGQDNPKESV